MTHNPTNGGWLSQVDTHESYYILAVIVTDDLAINSFVGLNVQRSKQTKHYFDFIMCFRLPQTA